MEIGEKVPNFQIKATNNIQTSIDTYRGKWLVLYFYPKDSTPGCTIEGCDFRDAYKDFEALNAVIFGISRDTLRSHDNLNANNHSLLSSLVMKMKPFANYLMSLK